MRLPILFAAMLLVAAPLRADAPTASSILEQSPTIAAAREGLLQLARESELNSRETAAEAWLAAAWTWEYESSADSAIACYRRAVERRGNLEELLGGADALFRRSAPGDADEALRYCDKAVNAGSPEGYEPQMVRARQAWARYLSGNKEQARMIFSRIERSLYRNPVWMLRMGQVAFANDDPQKAFAMGYPAAIASRGQSDDAMDLITKVADRMGSTNRAREQIQYDLSVRDRRHDAWVKTLGGRRIQFSGSGRFPLGATLFVPESKEKHDAIVALIAPDDSLLSWDSLGVRLRAAGFAVILIDGRGSGFSVARGAPLPESWHGRRGVMVEQTAADVHEGLRALALSTRIDTTRYTVMSSGSMTLPALRAAERDPRVQSLVMISADVPPVERGTAVAIASRIQVPFYSVETKIDRYNRHWIEPVYRASPAGISRMTDAAGIGTGPETLRSDVPGTERLTKWLREKKPARAKAATPPKSQPRG